MVRKVRITIAIISAEATRNRGISSSLDFDAGVFPLIGIAVVNASTNAEHVGNRCSGFLFSATAVEDPGFNPAKVIQAKVTFGGAQDMDNFCFCP